MSEANFYDLSDWMQPVQEVQLERQSVFTEKIEREIAKLCRSIGKWNSRCHQLHNGKTR